MRIPWCTPIARWQQVRWLRDVRSACCLLCRLKLMLLGLMARVFLCFLKEILRDIEDEWRHHWHHRLGLVSLYLSVCLMCRKRQPNEVLLAKWKLKPLEQTVMCVNPTLLLKDSKVKGAQTFKAIPYHSHRFVQKGLLKSPGQLQLTTDLEGFEVEAWNKTFSIVCWCDPPVVYWEKTRSSCGML